MLNTTNVMIEKKHPQGVVHHKAAYSFMIARPLKDITDQLFSKKVTGNFINLIR